MVQTSRRALPDLLGDAEAIAQGVLAPTAADDDRDARWPEEGMRALAEAGLMGLNVPAELGGHGLGLEALASIARVLARQNPSAALCFSMHCVGTAVVAAKATDEQRHRILEPIARGEHITTLALSEPGTGAEFYLPETRIEAEGDSFRLNGIKSFVTNGGRADSYVISTAATDVSELHGEGTFSTVIVEADTPGMEWQEPWLGMGMRGNSSRSLELNDVRIPTSNLLGREGDQLWYVFEVVAPFFLAGMAGTYLGIAEAAVEIAAEHLGSRRLSHTGELLGSQPILAATLGGMWIELDAARQLVLAAARRADAGAPDALPGILACKAAASQASVSLTNEAMTLTGGMGYRENGHLARLLRDARASHVMAPTTQMLKTWLGRALMGVPLLG